MKGVQDRFKKALGLVRVGGDTSWVVAAALLFATLAIFSVKDIEPGEAAVKVNNLTGSQTPVTRPGWTTRIPLLHSVYVLDAKPQTFSMKGEAEVDALHVSELSVRASDGSNFHFTDTTIIFQLVPSSVVKAVSDAGGENGFLYWMKPYARAVLRDEFGKESTVDVSDPTTYGVAASRAKVRLNESLKKHGVMVTQLVTPRPRFNKAYEKAIEDRNGLNNELEVIRSNLNRAETNRDRVLAEVDQEKNKIIQEKRASLEADLARAVARQAQVKREADTYLISKIAEGQAALSAANRKATELQGELNAKLEAKRAEIAAFRNQPVERVMERIGEKLSGVTIEIQPWSDDATLSRIQYQNRPGGN